VAAETLLSALYAPVMMLSHSIFVFDILIGRDGGWKPQRRDGGAGPWRVHWRAYGLHALVGVLTAALAWYLSPHVFLWLLPFTTGLMLAPALSRVSGSARAGRWLRRWNMLRSPQEERPQAILRWFEVCLGRARAPAAGEALRLLADDAGLRRWHLAQLPALTGDGDSIDVDQVVALAKVDRSDGELDKLSAWLTARQTLALLNDRPYLLGLENRAGPDQLAAQSQ
jgi:membrane glycosyltransferase